jgi:hypothetical protein
MLAAGLALAACGSSSGASSGPMTLTVATPQSGATVGRSFHVNVRSNVPFGAPSTGEHHLHLYFDGNKKQGQYDIVYGKSTTVSGLSLGTHKIEAEIANPDHSGTGVTQTFTVTVSRNAAAAAPSASTSTTMPSYGY